jgi:hypothetical protein
MFIKSRIEVARVFFRLSPSVDEYMRMSGSTSDATGKLGFSSYQKKKYSASIRMLDYGVAGDLVDEYMCMSGSTCIDFMH